MADTTVRSGTAKLEFRIGKKGENIGVNLDSFQWISFVNGGYIIRAVITDQYFAYLNKLAVGNSDALSNENYFKYLEESRSKPVEVYFRIVRNEELKTEERIAYLTNLQAVGTTGSGAIEFVAIDPSSYILNAGKSSGAIFKGCVSDVIKEVVTLAGADFPKPITLNITSTIDSKDNYWQMMRMDPKTFIMSLLDFSSSFTPKGSRWIVSSGADKDGVPLLNIKEEADLKSEHIGVFDVETNNLDTRDITEWNFEGNNFISAFQTKLVTGGISSTTGLYLDKITDPKSTVISGDNTPNKINTKTGPDRAYTAPTKDWSTFMQAVPEHNAGDVGISYDKYINGLIKQKYTNMTAMTMRLAVKLPGIVIDDSEKLGTSTCTLVWKSFGTDYFLSGNWIIYGFRHELSPVEGWHTTLYLYRIDWDYDDKTNRAKIVGPKS